MIDENYDMVYLVHESLHSYFKNDEITHTIIENISDLELAKFLNNSKKGYMVHDKLKNLHIKILPFWNLYLKKEQEKIENENKINNISYNQKDFWEYKTNMQNMDIDDFVKFIKQLNLEDLMSIKCSYSIFIKNM